jgi:lysozyme
VTDATTKKSFARRTGPWLAIAFACTAGFEGMRLITYLDPVRIPTRCFGHTKDVRMGQRSTEEECKALLVEDLLIFNDGVNKCVHVPMSPSREAGLTSFAFNVGIGAFCASTLVRRLNANDPYACNELLKWTKATKAGVKITLPGLVRRREEERRLCLA